MNKLISIACLLGLTSLLWTGCSKEDIDIYSGEDAIFFAQQWGVPHFGNDLTPTGTSKNRHQAYSKIPFGMMEKSDSLLLINIQTSGTIKDYDRPFRVEVVADSTTAIEGSDFELVDIETDAVIRAGETNTAIRVQFHKTEHIGSENIQLQLRIVPGEHFVLPFDKNGYGRMPILSASESLLNEYNNINLDPTIHNIFMNNILSEPERWNSHLMGIWSEEKFRILLDLTGKELGWTIATWADAANMWPMATRYLLAQALLVDYLLEQYRKGREYWVLDPDGTMMWCGGGAGLPWGEDARPEFVN